MGTERDTDIRLFRTAEHECGYYDDRMARDLVIDPQDPRLPLIYIQALANGFRRSGSIVYRPDCLECQACTALRLPIASFQLSRSQRRCLQRNETVSAQWAPPTRTPEQFDLYRRYLQSRHRDGGMDAHEEPDFDEFLTGTWMDTRFLEMREDDKLIGVAVTDVVDDGLSAVYTFFEPEMAARSLGTFAILRQIEWAREWSLPYLYLGYWIHDHPKMDYKRRYAGAQVLVGSQWLPISMLNSESR